MFETKYKVTIGDLNYGGHMGNDRALIVFQQARIDWLESMGYSETNIEGYGIIQLEANIKYVKEIFLNEVLTCKITEVKMKRASFTLFYEIFNENMELALKGSTKIAMFDYTNKKIVPNPLF